MKNYIYFVKNIQTNTEEKFESAVAILNYFKNTYNYKIPNYLRELLKNHGEQITIKIDNNDYIAYRKEI